MMAEKLYNGHSFFFRQAAASPASSPAQLPSPAAPVSLGRNMFQSGDFRLEWLLGSDSITFTVSMGSAGVALHMMAGSTVGAKDTVL